MYNIYVWKANIVLLKLLCIVVDIILSSVPNIEEKY